MTVLICVLLGTLVGWGIGYPLGCLAYALLVRARHDGTEATARRHVPEANDPFELFARCDLCGHRRGDHVGPGGACWHADEGSCASACGGYVAP